MTRPKVDPEKRQRTANACDSCKRRKQKVCVVPNLIPYSFVRPAADYCLPSTSVTDSDPATPAERDILIVLTPQANSLTEVTISHTTHLRDSRETPTLPVLLVKSVLHGILSLVIAALRTLKLTTSTRRWKT